MIITVLTGGSVGVLTFLTGRFWLGLIVGFEEEVAITFGLVRMSCTTLFYFIASINNVFGSALQAHGYSSISAVNSIVCVFIFRIIWMQIYYPTCADLPTYQRFFMVVLCFLVSWTLRLVVNVVAFSVVKARYNRGIRKVL